MGALESAVEWLRPLVKSKEWDYCVIWKLGDDPLRFIEWVDCCCGGGDEVNGCQVIVKEEGGGHSLCRDFNFEHLIRTDACVKLAQCPYSLPLYSGIHGEVAMSCQPRWLSYASTSNSNNETSGTQVLIPVVGGLIELFSSQNVPNDQKLVEFITAYYNVSMKEEIASAHSHTDKNIMDKFHDSPLVQEHLNYTPRLQSFVTAPHPSPYGIEGSSAGSTPSNEHLLLHSGSSQVSPNLSPIKSTGNATKSWKRKLNEEMSKDEVVKTAAELTNNTIKPKGRHKTGTEQFHSKNLETERKRRFRIKEGLFALRALVPNITKMDKAAILGDAIDYIQDLEKMARKYQTELKEMEAEDGKKNNGGCEIPELKGSYEVTKHSLVSENVQDSAIVDQSHAIQQKEVEMELNQIGQREFLLKVIHSHKRDGFLRLMKAVHSLGLQVIDANVTTCNDRVLNIIRIEAAEELVEPQKLRNLLLSKWTL